MKKWLFIFILLLLNPLSFAQAAEPVTIVVLPDAFSEDDFKNLSVETEKAGPLNSHLENEWQSLRLQNVDEFKLTHVAPGSIYGDLFSVASYDFATVIQLKSPQVETVLERQVLAQRYIARLSLLAQRWPDQFANIIIAGIGRGGDVGHKVMEMAVTDISSKINWLRNIKRVVSIGDRKRLVKLLGIVNESTQAVTDPAQIHQKNLGLLLDSLDRSMSGLMHALKNLNARAQAGEVVDKRKLAKVYTFYPLNILAFLQDLSKLQTMHAAKTAIKMTSLISDIITNPDFQGKLASFLEMWMTRPDKETAVLLIQELASPEIAQKFSELSDVFSDGKTYKEFQVVGKLYFHVIKNAVLESREQLIQSASTSMKYHDSAMAMDSLNKSMFYLGSTVSELKKGLKDIGQSISAKDDLSGSVAFEDANNPKLDRKLFIKVLMSVSSASASHEGSQP